MPDTADSEKGKSQENEKAKDSFKPIESKDDLERIISQRVQRERKRFSDYDDLKEKAERLEALEEQDKTELQKLQDKLAKAEEKAKAQELAAARATVSSVSGVPVDLLHGNTEDELQASAKVALDWLDTRIEEREQDAFGLGPSPTQGGESTESKEAYARRFLLG